MVHDNVISTLDEIRDYFMILNSSGFAPKGYYRYIEALDSAIRSMGYLSVSLRAEESHIDRTTAFSPDSCSFTLLEDSKNISREELVNKLGAYEELEEKRIRHRLLHPERNSFEPKTEKINLPNGFHTMLSSLKESGELSSRAFNALVRNGVKIVGDLQDLSVERLSRFRNTGEITRNEIVNLAERCGIYIKTCESK